MAQNVNFANQLAENQADSLNSALKQYFYVSFSQKQGKLGCLK
jgi:hypothetical protein